MNCPNCGAKNAEGAGFCISCGISLASGDENTNRNRNERTSKRPNLWLSVLIGTALVVVFGLTAYFVFGASSNNAGGLRSRADAEAEVAATREAIPVDSADKRVLKLFIAGFNCPSCSNGVKGVLLRNQGIVKARIEDSGKAKVIYDTTKTSRREIVSSIRQLGYDPKVVR